MIFEVFVEAAKGSRIDDQSHSVAIGRRFPRGARYPADYGFMPWSLADDQNPLDVVIITDEPSFPGRQLWRRAIAMLSTARCQGPRGTGRPRRVAGRQPGPRALEP